MNTYLGINGRQERSPLGLHEELAFAIRNTNRESVLDWGKNSAQRFGAVTVKRVTNLGSLFSRLTVGAADELVEALVAFASGRGTQHLGDRADRAVRVAQSVQESVGRVFDTLSSTASQRPAEGAAALLALVLGFYAGAGYEKDGFGDGGIPDLDLALGGIGWHRSIFTHSIIAGALVETAVLSLVDLVRVVHKNLPTSHSTFWDEMLRYSDLTSQPLVTGASLGIATHLGIDTFIDGFTPYKDLPISLPEGLHQALMGLNAAAEGAYGASRVASSLPKDHWGLHASPAPSRGDGTNMSDNKQPQDSAIQLPPPADVKARMEAGSLEARVDVAGEVATAIAKASGADPTGIEQAIEAGRRKLKAAKEPFRLGIVGEFRVGKSTLINALLGQEVAFTDIVEATAKECRFTHGERLQARIHLKDGESQEMSVTKANDILSARREDKQWLESVDHIEYVVPSERLRAFDLWDSPGLGGSDVNELVANTFIERIGGALWVFDAGLLGKASIAGPLKALRNAGKPLICVINRVDEYTGNRDELIPGVKAAYPGIFSAFAVISARESFETIKRNRADPQLELLWDTVLKVMGSDEAQGEAKRVERTSLVVANDLGRSIVALRRDILDRIGLIEHLRSNLDAARDQLLSDLPELLREETNAAFADLEAKIYEKLNAARGPKGDARRAADEIVSILRDEKALRALTDRVANFTMQRLNSRWSALTNEAVNLTRVAVPISANALSSMRLSASSPEHTQFSRAAIEQGVYVGGVSAVIAGTVAAASAAITWPVILAAIPIGALAAWREQKRKDLGDLPTHVQNVISAMKDRFANTLAAEIRDSITEAVDREVDARVQERNEEALGSTDLSSARQAESMLSLLCEGLGVRRPEPISSTWSREAVLNLLQNPGTRLDLMSVGMGYSLYPILVGLPPTTVVRLLIAVDRANLAALPEAVEKAFGNWQGTKQVRAVTTTSGPPPAGAANMIITAEEALVIGESLSAISDKSAVFTPYYQGRLAAQRLYASLWEGKGTAGSSLETRSIL